MGIGPHRRHPPHPRKARPVNVFGIPNAGEALKLATRAVTALERIATALENQPQQQTVHNVHILPEHAQ